jgi:hypothetical protein
MSKRPFPESSSPSQPAKRRQLSCLPSSSPPATPRTPRTPHLLVPSDSPTNPFGHDRSSSLILPRPTSFGKHLAFRVQLVRDGNQVRDKEGVYRIVQVPLNYTFRHLHKLLLFLFDGPNVPSATEDDGDVPPAMPRRSTRFRGDGKDASKDGIGHLFEVQKSATIYSLSYKAGQIRSGKTWAKLSTTRDPYRYRGSEEDGDEVFQADDDVESNAGENESEPEITDWRWEAEEDFTLAHVWPKGPDLSRAVIYVCFFPFYRERHAHHSPSQHHDSRTQIHMTINTSRIITRKGVGNQPYVFRARGIVNLGGETTDDDPKLDVSASLWNSFKALEQFLEWFPENTSDDAASDIYWDCGVRRILNSRNMSYH